MRRKSWSYGGFPRYATTPKRPPPARGIVAKTTGSTWWAQRWTSALAQLSYDYSNRLARGRTYARAGRTHDLEVKAGGVVAKVTGSRPTPYTVKIRLAKLTDAQWKGATEAMTVRAGFAAMLLAGEMPPEIDEAFAAGGASLFPTGAQDLTTECSCPDVANPCKHVAATHYVLAEALDRDPFLLFELRGRTKLQVLDALRNARADERAEPAPAPVARKARPARQEDRSESDAAVAASGVPTVTLGKLSEDEYDVARGAMPVMHLSFDEPVIHAAVLRQLGKPPTWSGRESPADLLAPIVLAAAARARRVAMAEPLSTEDSADLGADVSLGEQVATPKRPSKRSRVVTAPPTSTPVRAAPTASKPAGSPSERRLLEDVEQFCRSARCGDYYEDFKVNSKNFMDRSQGTKDFIVDLAKLYKRCVRAAMRKGDRATREAFEKLFALECEIDGGGDEIVFFADEAGAWQLGTVWSIVLPAWFRALAATADAEEFARVADGAIREHCEGDRAAMLREAGAVATVGQLKALRARAKGGVGGARESLPAKR
ncbi:MAG: SWIM zinc finger family protein [Deltaproteobacteria bacterium]